MTSTLRSPQIDSGAIRTYCNRVFGYLDGQATVRLIGELGTPAKNPHVCFCPVDQIADLVIGQAAKAATDQRAVFVVPATLKPGKRAKAEDILQIATLVVDLDKGDIGAIANHLGSYLGPPSLDVASGGVTEEGQAKRHLYWCLSEAATGADLALVTRLRSDIASKVGGDKSFDKIAQPIRVVGTIHGKHGHQTLVRFLACSDAEYHLADLADAVDAMPALVPSLMIDTGASRAKGPSAATLAAQPVHAGGLDDITRFEALSRVIGHWIRVARHGRVTLAEAWTAVVEHNAALIRPPWEDARLEREFRALLARDIKVNGPLQNDDANGSDALAPDLSEDALAQLFIGEQGADWRHVAVWGAWFAWTGQQWLKNDTGRVFHGIRLVCRAAASKINNVRDARRIAAAKTITAVQKIVACDPAISLDVDAFDAAPMRLNTPLGVIDLDSGTVEAHARHHLFTQITRVGSGIGCTKWLSFLDRATNGDKALQAYLARVAGYCLTGSTREQVFFFLHGSGANGKSVFLQTLAWIMGDYAATSTADAFTSRGGNRHLSELAGLRAARLVLVSETDAGEGWAEARIKSVTGGERVRANFMHRDHFEFTPQFKLMVAGNHRPSLSEVGEAMRRRLHVIPFTVTIPANQRDPHLGDTLKLEASGILGWMLDGCADWQKNGLQPPPAVIGAAEDYFASEDHIGQWLADCCVLGAAQRTAAKALFASWSDWARDNGFEPRSARFLGEHLRGRGFASGKVGQDRGWIGLTLRRHPLVGETA